MFEIKDLLRAPAGYIAFKNHAPGSMSMSAFLYNYIEHFQKACTCWVHRSENLCTRVPKCAHRVQGAPLISNTAKTVTAPPPSFDVIDPLPKCPGPHACSVSLSPAQFSKNTLSVRSSDNISIENLHFRSYLIRPSLEQRRNSHLLPHGLQHVGNRLTRQSILKSDQYQGKKEGTLWMEIF